MQGPPESGTDLVYSRVNPGTQQALFLTPPYIMGGERGSKTQKTGENQYERQSYKTTAVTDFRLPTSHLGTATSEQHK